MRQRLALVLFIMLVAVMSLPAQKDQASEAPTFGVGWDFAEQLLSAFLPAYAFDIEIQTRITDSGFGLSLGPQVAWLPIGDILVLGALIIITFATFALQEERDCARRFGRDYEAYCARVPRFNFLVGIFRHLRSNNKTGHGDNA